MPSIPENNTSQSRVFLSRSQWLMLAGLSAISLGVYLLISAGTFRIGLPLDDSYIHQVYGRNLGWYGEWSFLRGQPSAGSTSPLWTVILALGYFLHVPHLVWAFGCGWLLLTSIAGLGEILYRQWTGRVEGRFPWVGALLAFEWHLVWAAGSGMETLLSGLLILSVLAWMTRDGGNSLWVGILVGISIWVRPDGLTLIAPVGLFILFRYRKNRFFIEAGKCLAGFLAGVIPYLLLNRFLAGTWMPNTFYAKQAEYTVLQQIPIWERYWNEFSLSLIGVGALLLPGVVVFGIRAIKNRNWGFILGIVWWLGYVGLYAIRLPVTYQHGRYMMPLMPIFFVWGAAGTITLLQPHANDMIRRVFSRVWQFSIVGVLLGFWVIGGMRYAEDVAIIESEMVDTAQWVAKNTPADTLVAAHDIGALGYYSERQLIDLAGLVTPEVIPFLRDETQLMSYLDEREVDLLIAMPEWYPRLTTVGKKLYASPWQFSTQAGGEKVVIYAWKGRP